jgi:hypothetical protein
MGKLNRKTCVSSSIEERFREIANRLHNKIKFLEGEVDRLKLSEMRIRQLEQKHIDLAIEVYTCEDNLDSQDQRIKDLASKSMIIEQFEHRKFHHAPEA